jgi:hypothetical protein
MLDNIVEKLSEKMIRRRSFLGRAVAACSAVALAVLGFGESASAYAPSCCTLCTQKSCGGNFSQCAGQWCWVCYYKEPPGTCRQFQCVECYNSSAGSGCFNTGCIGGVFACGCSNIICSQYVLIGTC